MNLKEKKLYFKMDVLGAEVNRTTPTGKTPLHLASAQGHGELVNMLLQHGRYFIFIYYHSVVLENEIKTY